MVWVFDEFELDGEGFELRAGGSPVSVQPKVLETLVYLVERRDRVVSKEELLRGPWAGAALGDTSLSQAVMQARRALGDDGERQRFIRTVRGRGFRFVGDVQLGAAPRSPRPVIAPDPQGIVGRDVELAALRGALAAAERGRGGVRFVTGPPGIGKTRILEQLEGELGPDSAVTWGRGWEGGGAPAYRPWSEALRELVRGDAGEVLRSLPADVALDLEALLFRDAPAGEGAARFRLFDAVVTLLVRTGERRPVLVLLEDLHAADVPSIRLLEFAAAPLRRSRVLVVASHRDGDLDRDSEVRAILHRIEAPDATLQLGGLGGDAVRELVERVAGTACASSWVERIGALTHGNPLFVQEVVRGLSAEGHPLTSEAGFASGVRLPERVAEAIRARLERLPQATLEVLSLGAVLAGELSLEVVSALAGREPAKVMADLAPALEAGVVAETGTPGRLRFSHALVKEALYDGLPALRRVEIHRDVVAVLDARSSGAAEPPFSVLGHHAFQAGPLSGYADAVRYASAAAERALRVGAYEQAAEHYSLADRALELASGDAPTRAHVLLALGTSHRLAGHVDRALHAFGRAADIGREARLPVLVAHAAIGWGDTRRESGQVDEELVRLLREALEGVDPGPNRLVARLKARLSAALYFRGPAGRAQAEELSREALHLARKRGDPLTLVAALLARHFVRWGSAPPHEELVVVEEILAVLGDPPLLVDAAQEARLWQISDLLELGKANEVKKAMSAYAAATLLSKTPLHRSWAARHRALEALVTGRFDEALRSSEESEQLGRSAQDPNASPFHAAYRAEVAGLRGDRDELSHVRVEIAAVASTSPLVVWRAHEARVASQLGDHRKAAQNLSNIVDECSAELEGNHTRFAAFATLAEVAVALGDHARGERLYRELLPHLDRFVVSGSAALFHGPAAFPAGRLAVLLGRVDDARAHFERALELSRGLEARPFVALALDALGRTLTDKAHAARLRKEAEALAAELGLAPG